MNSNLSVQTTTSPKPSFFDNPKKAKGIFVLFLILFIVFFLASGAVGYLYWQKNKNLKEVNKQKQEQQEKIAQFEKDKADLQKQVADLTKENEELKILNQQSSETTANKKAIIQAYTEILTYFAQVVETHGGFTGWTEAEYQQARKIAQKTQSSSFIATVDWAWNQTSIDPVTRVARFLKEIATGINQNL